VWQLPYAKYVRAHDIAEFGECACARGSLGILLAKDVTPIALANAQRIATFRAKHCQTSFDRHVILGRSAAEATPSLPQGK
jgi:hypothetical protein